MKNENGKLEWFNGNEHALNLYRMFVDVAHTWDDLIDKDKEVTEEDINYAFYLAFVMIPANPVYQAHFQALHPILANSIMGYMVANKMERSRNEHEIEIAHTLRYSVANVFMYLVTVFNGIGKAQELMPEILKVMIPERYADYLKEHQHAQD